MPYQACTIATAVGRLNVQYFLPAIQREFVWRPDQIIQLFDSIMRNYPFSTFLLWDLKPENRDRWDVYRFIEHFHANETHNELAATAGLPQMALVLDGQQRFTSLLIGLKGSYTLKRKYKRQGDPSAWVKHQLYLDLFQDPDREPDDGDLGVRYGFAFLPQRPEGDAGRQWFPVRDILNFDSEDRFEQYKYEERDKLPDDTTRGQQRVFEKNLDRLYRAVWKNESVSYYTEHDQDYDRVLDIFVRANEGGTKLSKSDLLLSMVTSKWAGVNAREEIYGFVDRINQQLARKNDFDKDFVLKTSLVVTDLPVQYKVDNFSNQNLALIQRRWEAVKAAIEAGVNLVNWFGIDRDNLTSANALIPVIYYMAQHPGLELRSATHAGAVRNASAVRRWLTAALLNGVFGGSSDNILRDIRRVLQEHGGGPDFPIEALNTEIAKVGRTSRFDEAAVENFLEIGYGRRASFMALSLLYDDNSWGSMAFQQDHIFPRSHFTPKRLADSGLSAAKQERYATLADRIGNLQLLLPHENQAKSDREFKEWLLTRDADYRRRHLIPDNPGSYEFDRFEEFVAAREKLIRDRLRAVFAPTPEAPPAPA